MKGEEIKSSDNIIDIIDHLESDLWKLKKPLREGRHLKGQKKVFRSVRQYEFCGMWKDRADMEGLSSAEWLANLRKEQWGRSQ